MSETEPTIAATEGEWGGCASGRPCTCHPAAATVAAAVGVATTALSKLRKGQIGRICECQLSPDDAALLRAMGLCTNARVRLCRAGEPCIVAIECGKRTAARIVEDATRRRGGGVIAAREGSWTGSRIGLARSLAERILVAVDHQ